MCKTRLLTFHGMLRNVKSICISRENGNYSGRLLLARDTIRCTKRYDYRAISWLQNLNLSFQQRRFPFFSRTFPATRARGSRDLRPRVTRPAPAGHATCARGSLAMRRSETEISLGKLASPRGRTYLWLAIAVKPSKHRNYLGGFLIANCAGKKCTARCSQRVSTEFVLIAKAKGIT